MLLISIADYINHFVVILYLHSFISPQLTTLVKLYKKLLKHIIFSILNSC
jgi:hypothetical protein